MTNLKHAFEYCHGLHSRLLAALADVTHVREVVARLEPLAKTYPETRFCKGLVLPVIDQWTNEFLRKRYGASAETVFTSLRCEGFENLSEFYLRTGQQTHYCGTPKSNRIQAVGKNGKAPGRAYPDWAIRYVGAEHSLRLVGEAKYCPGKKTRNVLVNELRHDLAFDLAITDDEGTDWGHDFGYGVAYAAGGDGRRNAEFVEDYWESDRILLSVFWARP